MKFHSISSRMLLWLGAISLLPLIVVSLLLLNAFEQAQVKSVRLFLSQVADMKANQISSHFSERLVDLQILARGAGTIQALETLPDSYARFGINSAEYLQNEALIRDNYSPLLESHYYDMFLISASGEIVFSLLHEDDFATNLLTGPYKETALADVVRRSLTILSADISDLRYYQPSKKPACFIAAPVLKDGVIFGIIAAQISTEHIYEVVRDDTGLGETGEAVVARRDGNDLLFMAPLKFDPDAALKRRTPLDSATAEPMKHALRGERGFGIALDYRNVKVAAAWRYLPGLRWGLVVKRDASEALGAVKKLRRLGLYTLIFILTAVVVVAWFLGRSIVVPIQVLTNVTAAIANGALGKRAEVHRDDEIGQLASSFNNMADRVQESQDMLEDRVAERTARLDEVNRSLRHEVDERIKAEDQLRLTSTVFEHTSEAIIITDADALIIDCNQAFVDITGYSLAEIRGKNPRVTSSGRHDLAFFQAMWQSINQLGNWSGEIWDRRKNGEIYPKWLSINAVSDSEGAVSHYIGVFTDISDLKDTERRLEELVFMDALTGLPNRQLFNDRLNQELSHAHRHESRVALFFIDLDQFKQVNDTLGHQVGDWLLQEVAKRLQSCVRENDTVARLGGDEFTVILTDIASSKVVADIAGKIIGVISKPMSLRGHELFISASIGISLYPDDHTDKEALIRYADAAMYDAKEKGRGNFQFFSEEINLRNQQRRRLENNLRRAIRDEEFELYYQPQMDIATNEIIGSEALIRWNDPNGDQVPSSEFIPFAEENGMILEIGAWVIVEACKHLRRCLDAGRVPVRVAINLSAVQFKDDGLVEMIQSVLKRERLSADLIELEITESAFMENADEAVVILERLSALGIRISIDDFGTGYSSLAYLKKFPVDSLKIDQDFIRGLPDNSDDAVLTTAITKLAISLGIGVLAEGVETRQQVEFLRRQGCRYAQGFYFSRPLPEDEFAAFVSSTAAGEHPGPRTGPKTLLS